jgi:hypothetical protein
LHLGSGGTLKKTIYEIFRGGEREKRTLDYVEKLD